MKYFFDTEFHEYTRYPLFGAPCETIELISIGIKAEDGRTLYAVSKDFNIRTAYENEWLRDNVLKPIFDELLSLHIDPTGWLSHPNTTGWPFTYRSLKYLIRKYGMSNIEIKNNILKFTLDPYNTIEKNWMTSQTKYLKYLKETDFKHHYHKPIFYAYYADYDWVRFCWLFGRMIDLPASFPKYCIDLQQLVHDMYVGRAWKKANCPNPKNEHNALADAEWNFKLFLKLKARAMRLSKKNSGIIPKSLTDKK